MKSPPSINGYPQLLARVRKVLIQGQVRIEQEKVRVYWETGRIIHAEILKNRNRAEYGAEVLENLSKDLQVHVSVLRRCVQFYDCYSKMPIHAGRREFSWSHYRELIKISDDKRRARLEKAAVQKGWTAEELAHRIRNGRDTKGKRRATSDQRQATQPSLPTVKPGKLYTYTTLTPPHVFATSGKVVADLGFSVSRKIARRDWPGAKFQKTSDYTYRAHVERVIDGDTLKAHIDLGFNVFVRQKLRLKGINAPEVTTQAGQKAKRFVQRQLRGAGTITLVTRKSDKYDRYLADVFVPKEEGRGKKDAAKNSGDKREETNDTIYLNQALVDAGLAGVYGE